MSGGLRLYALTERLYAMAIRYGSVCSGIEAATVAWHSLGWEPAWFSEIEKFPKAVLAHHYPDIPDLGDMCNIALAIRGGTVEAPDMLVGGTPCQAFSIAGLKKSLDDERGNLSLEYVRIADAIDDVRSVRGEQPVITLWENVPGVLNTKDNAFGCLLGALAGEDMPMEPPGGRWKNAGCVFGPKRSICWRVLDAQFFGLAQRRRRVFVVSSAREGFRPQEILFEFEGGRRDTPPGREEGQGTAPAAQGGTGAGGAKTFDIRDRRDGDTVSALVGDHASRPTDYTPVVTESVLPFDTTQVTSKYNYSNPKEGDPCHPLAAGAHPPAVAVGSETGAQAVDVRHGTVGGTAKMLQAGGMGSDRGMCINALPHVISLQDVRARDKAQNSRGWNDEGVSYTVDAAATQGVAYGADLSQKAEGIGFKEEQAPCVAPGTHPGHGAHAVYEKVASGETGPAFAFQACVDRADPGVSTNGERAYTLPTNPMSDRGQAVAFKSSYHTRGKDKASSEVCPPPTKEADKGDQDPPVLSSAEPPARKVYQVRRLIPRECERLQGFPDDYTRIPWRKKDPEDCPDGPRYKALGNSMAVTVMAWIGSRMNEVFEAVK